MMCYNSESCHLLSAYYIFFYCGISKLQKSTNLPTVPIMFLFVCFFVFNVMAKGPRQGSQVALGCGLCWTCWVVSKGRLVGVGVSAWAGVRPQVTCGCGCIDSHRRTLVSTSEHLGRGSGAGLEQLENF